MWGDMVVGYLAAMIVGIALYSAMGIVSLAKNGTSPLNRLYSAMAFALVLWSLAFAFQQVSDGPWGLLPKMTASLSVAFFSLLCHSSFFPFADGWKRAGPAAIYGGCLVALVSVAIFPENAGALSRNLGLLAHTARSGSPGYLVQNAFCLMTGLAGLAILSIRAFKMEDPSKRRAAILRLSFLGVSLALFYADQAILPLAFRLSAPYCSPLAFAPWALAVLYARSARGFLAEGGPVAAETRTSSLPDYSVLVDPEGTIIEANERAQDMLGRKAEDLIGKPFDFAIERPESLRSELRRMAAANEIQSSCAIAWISFRGKPCRGRSRITAVKNSFGRATGYLITPFTLGGAVALKDEFSLTDRELEVIHFAAQGLPNNAIARELSITERTVKAHLTNIFNKMGIDSRFKLISRLKDFDV